MVHFKLLFAFAFGRQLRSQRFEPNAQAIRVQEPRGSARYRDAGAQGDQAARGHDVSRLEGPIYSIYPFSDFGSYFDWCLLLPSVR